MEKWEKIWTTFMLAAKNGHTETVQALLQAEADINKQNKKGWTVLMIAARNEHTATVQALLEAGADITTKSKLTCP